MAPFSMSFSKLYAEVQQQQGRISTKWLRERAIALSHITAIKEQWSSVMDDHAIRGLYIEGPLGPPVPLNENQALIVLARSMCTRPDGPHWRRMVLTKELMHVFDEKDEKADSPETFDRQIEKFADPNAAISPQFVAEAKAYWRALAVLCQEEKRREFERQVAASEISFEVVAVTLHLPVLYVRELLRTDFGSIIGGVI